MNGQVRASQIPPRADAPLLDATALARRLSLRPGEGLRTGLLFALLFVASMIFVMGRTARDALFLTKFPVEWIAYMWVAYGIASAVFALGFGWISARAGRERLAVTFACGAAGSYILARLGVGADSAATIAVFYVWSEIVANLFIVQAWMIANDLHDPRSAKRLFGLIGAGRIVGMLLSGFVTSALVRAVGTANLIVTIALLMFAFVVLVRAISSRFDLPQAAPPADKDRYLPPDEATAPTLRRYRPYVVLLSVMILAAFMALTLGDYQFKAIAKLTYPNRDELAEYMAGFYAAMGALALLFQLLLTPLILRKRGVMAALFTMPVAFLSSTVALIFAPGLVTATALKLSDNGLQYTIHDATMQLVYFAVPSSLRTRVRAWLDAMIKPLGYSLGGVVLVLISPLVTEHPSSIARIGVLTLGLGVVWIAMVPPVRRAYVESLRRSISRRESDVHDELDLPDDFSMRQVLLDTLHEGRAPQVVFAMERLAENMPSALKNEVPSLLNHPSPVVRAQALRHACAIHHPDALEQARTMLADTDATVRSAALDVIGHLRHDDAVDEIGHFVDDDKRPLLRDAAVATLVAHGGLSGVIAGGVKLQQLLRSELESDRVAAARILADVAQPSLARSLRPLLADPSRTVRLAGIAAAERCGNLSLVDPLLDAMSDRGLTKAAARALAALGPPAIGPIAARLGEPSTPRIARLNLPRVLHSINTHEALNVLLALIDDEDEGVRQKVLASASRLREALHAPGVDPARLRSRIELELAEHVQLRESYLAARRYLARPLLDSQIRLELRGNIVRIMRLCELAYPREHVAAARSAIFSKNPIRRANALEVLDNVLSHDNREAVVEVVDSFATKCNFGPKSQIRHGPVPALIERWFSKRIELPGHYRRALALESVGVNRADSLAPHALRFVTSSHPFVRESALIALAACHAPGWKAALESAAATDDHELVRGYARYVLETHTTGLAPEDEMYTTVEKILFLQGVPLFAGVVGNDLMPLAMSSTVVRLPAGSALFREGDPGNALYIVIHGRVLVRKGELEIAALGIGEVVGEMAILDQAPRMADAVVVEDAVLLRVSADDFAEALQDTAELANGVIRVLSQRLREAMAASPGEPAAEARKTII